MTLPTSEGVRSVRERLVAAGVVTPAKGGEPRKLSPVSIGRREGEALREWVRKERALQTLEIGIGFGIATLFLFEGLLANGDNPHHVAVDPYQFKGLDTHQTLFGGIGLQNLEEAGVRDLVEFYEEESQAALPRLLAEGRRFDLAFIDGSHRFEAVFLDLVYCGRLLHESRIVFVDDTQLPGVLKAVNFCVANLDWNVEDEGAEGDKHHWLVLRTGSADVWSRPFTQFADF